MQHFSGPTALGIDNETRAIDPFLKWAGGKRWMIPYLSRIVGDSFSRHVEPFLGSGAIFFHNQPQAAFLSDSNEWLIETYISMREEPDEVLKALIAHEQNHCEEYYYAIRAKNFRKRPYRAAQLIYLNKTCWNALFRVNLKGSFNVPIGSKPMTVDKPDNFDYWSTSLRRAYITCADFALTFEQAGAGDFIFADPPYVTTHSKNGFLKYNQNIFSWDDQVRLAHCAKAAAKRGALVVVTNAPHESVLDLYRELRADLHVVERPSVIAADSKNRRKVNELIAVLGR